MKEHSRWLYIHCSRYSRYFANVLVAHFIIHMDPMTPFHSFLRDVSGAFHGVLLPFPHHCSMRGPFVGTDYWGNVMYK